jgi:hypothetical protein
MSAVNSLKTVSRRKRHILEQSRSANGVDGDDAMQCDARFITSIDFLGEPITFNFKGSKTYGSCLGTFCSLLVVGVLIYYLTNGFLAI